jgi:spiro-SPASM protein
LCRRIAAAACRGTHEVLAWVSANPPAHRTLPRYIQVQVLEQEVHRVAYSPYPLTRPEPTMPGSVMEARTFAELISRISRCSPEATVAVSVWGEIALHPDAEELIRAATKDNRLSLIVETSGVGWTAECAGSFIQDPPPRTSWIVGLDTADPEVYRQVRGEGFAEATEFAQKMLAAAPDSTYVQAVRAPQIDQTLQDFYKEWTARTENVIIQKYDWFCGRLPMSALGDNAPLRRPPCRHLQRDMVILLDGTVPLCREDLEVDVRLGNALEEELSTVWDRGAGHYNDHTRRRYSSLCKDCDEYYTFNA